MDQSLLVAVILAIAAAFGVFRLLSSGKQNK
jgi:type II secretory pathway pseudopilin PulG